MKVKNTARLNELPYHSPDEEAMINGSGDSMKSSFLTVVALNLLLKLLLQSSMSAMWGAVHALQIFHLLLHMNIPFPDNLI